MPFTVKRFLPQTQSLKTRDPPCVIRSGSLLIAPLHGKGVETAVHHGHRTGDKSRGITDKIVNRAT